MALGHVADKMVNSAVSPTRSVSAADRQDLQNRIKAAHYNGVKAEAVSSAKSKKSAKISITRTRDRVILDAGGGKDDIQVFRKKDSRGVVVRVNGKSHAFSEADANRLTIRAGSGDDRIFVGTGVRINLTLEGGKGKDRIIGGDGNERIRGGAGRDYINGAGGNDTLYGNSGDDALYGGYGSDRISGGRGDDYGEGGTGRDFIDGNQGRDILSGGRGNDSLRGSSGADHLYAGLGRDRLYGSSGNDTISAQRASDEIRGGAGDDKVVNVEMKGTPGGSIKVVGSGRFRERVNADLDFLRSFRTGRTMLEALDRGAEKGNVITIEESSPGDGNFTSEAHRNGKRNPRTGKAGKGEDATIYYLPSKVGDSGGTLWGERPPVVGLYHEMVHGYNSVTGTVQPGNYKGPGIDKSVGKFKVRNDERQAVGLKVDHDNNDDTARREINPPRLTENGLRKELGLPRRTSYNT